MLYNTAMNLKTLLVIIFSGIVVILFIAMARLYPHESIRHIASTEDLSVFEEIPVEFHHQWQADTEPYPFSGATVIDIENDGRPRIFIGGGRGQDDVLLSFEKNKLVDRIKYTGLSEKDYATYGAAATDLDNDGDIDLLVARENGLYAYKNHYARFTKYKIKLKLPEDSEIFSIATADYDGDGDADIYLSIFISNNKLISTAFNDPAQRRQNILLRNDGKWKFTNATQTARAGGDQRTFVSAFVDLDNDGWQDLVLAHDIGRVGVLRNKGDGSFADEIFLSDYGFWMGIAIGDVDQDGDADLMLTNVGNSIPAYLLKEGLQEGQTLNPNWILLRNEGKLKFTDVTADYGLDGYGFAWGAMFEDLDLDGQQDLLVAQNYIKWPLHEYKRLPGKVLLQRNSSVEKGFYQADSLGLNNSHYAQSPMIIDLNRDGRPDVLWLNSNGPARAYLNKSARKGLTVRFADTVKSQTARVEMQLRGNSKLVRRLYSGEGFMVDNPTELYFPVLPGVRDIKITWPDDSVLLIPRNRIKRGGLVTIP